MAVTRSFANGYEVVEYTNQIENIQPQWNYFNSSNLFDITPVSQDTIIFDKSLTTTTLLPQVSTRSRESVKEKADTYTPYALILPHFKDSLDIVPEDLKGFRQVNTAAGAEQLAAVRLKKLERIRGNVDQTVEYMKLQAIKGITKSPDGKTVANMFTEFSVAQPVITFNFADPAFDVRGAIALLQDTAAENLLTGGTITNLNVMVSKEFFAGLTSHPQTVQAFQYQQGSTYFRDGNTTYNQFATTRRFDFMGVSFFTYNATFNLPNGTKERAIAAQEGHVIAEGITDLYRGHWGSSDKLSGVNQMGREVFVYEYPDLKDERYELQYEFKHLYFITQPLMAIKVVNTNIAP